VNWLERIVVRRFLLISVVLSVGLITAVCVILFKKLITLEQLSKATDSILKGLAVIIGGFWSVNRYFATRTDYPQLRVDLTVDSVPNTAFGKDAQYGLLSYRLDIVNTGKALLPVTGYRTLLSNVTIHEDKVGYELLHRWPSEGMHPANPIEPGSWGAVSQAVAFPKDVLAVHVFLDVELERKNHWTWHRVISVPKIPGQEATAIDVKEAARS
jgi:hypothetical protein